MNLLRPITSLFGYDIIRKSKDLLIDRHLANLLRRHQINMIIDAGANQGQYGRFLRKLGYEGIIHSFEPLGSAYERLQQAASDDPLWHTHHMALGSEASELQLNVAAYSDFSSFLHPNEYCADTFTHKAEIERQETVSVKILDQLFPQLAHPAMEPPRVHLKMDTQGYDLQVFAGTQQTLPVIQTLQSEVSIRKLYEGMPDYLTALKIYTDTGFNISGLFPVTRDKTDLSVIEFDCVMVKPINPEAAPT